MFCPIFGAFSHFESLALIRKWGDKAYTKAVEKDILVNFSKVQHIKDNFSKKLDYFG